MFFTLLFSVGTRAEVQENLTLLGLIGSQDSKPIVEFRARGIRFDKNTASLTGHTFVMLGREAADHTIIYYAVAGFLRPTIAAADKAG